MITELNSHLKKSQHSHERYRGKMQRLPRSCVSTGAKFPVARWVGAYANRSAVPDQRYYFSTFVTLRVAEIQNNEENVSEKQASKTW